MKKLMFLFAFILMIGFSSAVTLTEHYNDTSIVGLDTWGVNWEGQTFTIGTTGLNQNTNLINISIRGYRVGTPPTINVYIQAVNSSGHPVGSNLSTGSFDANSITTATSGEQINISMSAYTLLASTKYALIIDNGIGNSSNAFRFNYNATGTYSGGNRISSGTSGVSWSVASPFDAMFWIWSDSDVGTMLNSPQDDFLGLVQEDINFNVSSSASSNLVNVSLIINGTINETVVITGQNNITIFTKSFSDVGNYNWTAETCDDKGNCSLAVIRDFNLNYYVNDSVVFTTPALVGDSIDFSFPFNISSGLTVSGANLIYNDTPYSVSVNNLGGGIYNLTRTLIIPTPSGTIPFYFNVTLSNAVKFNSSSNDITINPIGLDDCSVFTNVLYNFTAYDEKTQAFLNGASSSVNHSLTLELFNTGKTESLLTFSNEYTNTNPSVVCLQNNLSSSSDFVIDLQIQYTADGYANEYYNIFGDSLDINDMGTLIPLYLLDNDSSQEFEITYRDSSFLPVTNAVIQIQRKYISEGIFRTVEQPKTGSEGKTLAHLELDDVIYNFIILIDGVVSATFNDRIVVCQNPSFNDCEFILDEIEGFVEVTDFNNLDDFTFTGPLFDEATRTVSATFSITSGSTSTVILNVTLFDALGDTFVCDNTLLSSSGELSCVVPTSFGNTTIIATLYQDGVKKALGTFTIGQTPSDLYGNNLVIVGLIIFFSFLGLGMSGNPVVTGAFMILTAIVLIVFNVFQNTGFVGAGATILWFIVAVIILMIKGAKRI